MKGFVNYLRLFAMVILNENTFYLKGAILNELLMEERLNNKTWSIILLASRSCVWDRAITRACNPIELSWQRILFLL
jgi:hypothetical protein